MKISIISYFFLTIILFACKNSPENKQGKIDFVRPNILSTDPNQYLLGQWTICSEGGENGTIQYNVCQEIVFGTNNMGSFFKGGVITESINWNYKEDTLNLRHISFFNNDTAKAFPDVIYNIKRSEDSNFVYLKIIQPTKKYFLNLSRSKIVTITNPMLFD